VGEPINEEAIIQQILSGRVEAYEEIVRGYQQKVLGLCLSFLKNSTEAEDAAQEIFIKAYQSLPSFRGLSLFSTWLYRIAANHCKDLLRKRSREKTESLEALMDRMGDSVERMLQSPPEGPRAGAEYSELIEGILCRLSPQDRTILTLREAEGLSYQEISETLQCSVEAVRSRLRRARQTLEERLRHFSKGGNV
jgi:RNA polymerase sigma-70 factor, ECF subfamily